MGQIEDRYVQDISVVIDNDQVTYERVRNAINNAIRTQHGHPDLDPDTYDDLRRNREWELHATVGLAVADEIRAIAKEDTSGITLDLMLQFLDGLENALGDAYVPDAVDYRSWYEEQED